MKSREIRRREFLKAVGGGAAASILSGSLCRQAQGVHSIQANDKIGFALIGCGDLGRNHHLSNVLTRDIFQVKAVADPDDDHLQQAIAMTEGRAQGYKDYRALLDRKDVDAVMIVTPDHWHALAAIDACRAGKDVYCEKPLSLTIEEGRAMVNAARRYGRVFQTGSQQRSDYRFRWACDLVRNGRLGTLRKITTTIGGAPTTEWHAPQQVPAHLDWDLWLGPAPWAPYAEARCHYTFRWIYDYSGGKMTDWGAHHHDIAQWALGADDTGPVEVWGEADFPIVGLWDTPTRFDVHYRYENGVELHSRSDGENGVMFEGAEGSLFVSRSTITADPADILDIEPDTGTIRLPLSLDHRSNWIECMQTRERPICDVEIGHRSATVCHLGNIALRVGRKLRWDPRNEHFVGDEEANRHVTKPKRHPWTT